MRAGRVFPALRIQFTTVVRAFLEHRQKGYYISLPVLLQALQLSRIDDDDLRDAVT